MLLVFTCKKTSVQFLGNTPTKYFYVLIKNNIKYIPLTLKVKQKFVIKFAVTTLILLVLTPNIIGKLLNPNIIRH